MTKMLDLIHMMQRGEIAPPPVAALIGFTLASVEPGCAVVEFEATPRHANPMGTLHGGVLCDIADATIGLVECDVVDEKRRLVARASSTVMTLRGAQATGR